MTIPGESAPRGVAYYVTAHGYGHGVRSCDIICALNKLYPKLPVVIVSDHPASFFRNRLGEGPYTVRPGSFDFGMVQLDSIRVNVQESLKSVLQLYDHRKELVAQETEFLRSHGIGLVVVDIPGIPLESAESLGIPRIAVGNFSWDWIYSAYVAADPRWESLVRLYQDEYSKADLLLRLPFSPEMNAFPRIEDIPLVASPGQNRRCEIAGLTGADFRKEWILVSFTTLEWNDEALDNVAKLDACEFFAVLPLEWRRMNIHSIDRDVICYSDVVASMDGVITKPGFGILSDCLVNKKPLIYADRSDFLEYTVLEAAIKKYFKHQHIPAEKLYRGEVGEAIENLWSQPEPSMTLASGGATIAAGRMREYLD
jgi:L-arabinokinase